MTRKEYIHQLAQEIIRVNQPVIDRIVKAEVDKIKAQLASLAPNMADRRKMLAVMGSAGSLGVYLANVDKLQANKSDIATNAFTAPQQAPNPREYFGKIWMISHVNTSMGNWTISRASISTVTIWSTKVSVNISMAATSLIAA